MKDKLHVLESKEIEQIITKTREGAVFWKNFVSVYGQSVGKDNGGEYIVPLIICDETNSKPNYMGKMVLLGKDNSKVDMEEGLMESPSLPLLLSYLVKEEIINRFKITGEQMTFGEIGLAISTEGAYTKQNIQLRYNNVIESLQLFLKNEGYENE